MLILWQKVHYFVYQSIPTTALQISTMTLSALNNDDLTVLGDHCIPQLNDTKAKNAFSSQGPFISSLKLLDLFIFAFRWENTSPFQELFCRPFC